MMPLVTVAVIASLGQVPADGLDRCNVVWTAPSKDSWGSMPLGNGDVGVNLWVEAGGDLLMLISKTDAWDAHCRLLKLGRVRVKLSPNPFAEGLPFRQELKLRQGCVEIVAGKPGETVTVRVWVDAHVHVVRVEARADRPIAARADLEIWRSRDFELTGRERDSARGVLDGGYPLKVPADRVVDANGRVVWYHRNVESCFPVTLKVQGLGELLGRYADPLLHRTFGGAIVGAAFVKAGPTTLRTPAPAKRFDLAIHALTKQPATEQQWLAELERVIEAGRSAGRADHEKWWADFWNRSWIYASGTAVGAEMGTNSLPLRIGAGSTAGNRFHGDVTGAMVFSRALDEREVACLAARKGDELARDPALVGHWTFDNLKGGAFANRAGTELPAKVVGDVASVDAPGGKAVRLSGKGYLEVPHHARLDLREAVTLAAWVRPAEGSTSDGRILDKSRAGTSNGYLLDTWPGGTSLRIITEPGTLTRKACLAPGKWSHVAGTFDGAGRLGLYVNGRCVESRPVGGDLDTVTRTYQLQRFINACAGRGGQPIKFNGSIFTVDSPDYSPDYRRWGGCYWWQNTRLPYWAMIPCGDWDLMGPLFEMYSRMLPLRKDVTRTYYGHDGAFFAETMYFWGTPCNDDHRWKRTGQPDHLMLNPYIRREWQGGLELAMMMLDRYDYTQDEEFARTALVPLADAVLTFYDKHYPREKDGTLRIDPAQSLETWWKAVNPMPEIAGLRAVLARMGALPKELTSPRQREAWKKLAGQVPPIPTRKIEGKDALAAAELFSDRHNCENPELYAIFPYRLFGLRRPGLDVALWAFEKRLHRHNHGWQQDPVQSAMLGLADTAGRLIVRRSAAKHAGSRFDAFWGPNFDWIPDQDHGGNNMMGLQAMALQPVGRKILLLPAWPKAWDVHFKLHAPYRTTVECVYRGGKVERLNVTPPERAKDVVRPALR
ncbi:MAG: DUF5703 domain-containing protein [Phycisphaerae bacterium]